MPEGVAKRFAWDVDKSIRWRVEFNNEENRARKEGAHKRTVGYTTTLRG